MKFFTQRKFKYLLSHRAVMIALGEMVLNIIVLNMLKETKDRI